MLMGMGNASGSTSIAFAVAGMAEVRSNATARITTATKR
jgi:hypothetical protein